MHKKQNKKLSYRLETGRQHSAIHFFVVKLLSIAVMTYILLRLYHLRNLYVRQICYAHSE